MHYCGAVPTQGRLQLAMLEEVRAPEPPIRLSAIFLRDNRGERPVYGGTRKFQDDPHWRDLILFYEYFHGDNGAGLGASHQTGWTGVVATLMHVFATVTPEAFLAGGRVATFGGLVRRAGPQPEGGGRSAAQQQRTEPVEGEHA